MIQLDASVGSATSNSYVTVDEVREYFDNHWSLTKTKLISAMSDDQLALLAVAATRVIDGFRFTEKLLYYPQTSSLKSSLPTTDIFRFEFDAGSGSVQLDYPFTEEMANVYASYQYLVPLKYDPAQALQFPRNKDIDVDGDPFLRDAVKMATCEQMVYMSALDEAALTAQAQGIKHESLSVGGFSQNADYTGDGTMLAPVAREMLKDLFWRRKQGAIR